MGIPDDYYKNRENGLEDATRNALRLYDDLMREQPSGDHGHEVDPKTAEAAPSVRLRTVHGPRNRTAEREAPEG